MKYLLIILVILVYSIQCFPQSKSDLICSSSKPIIDSAAINHWVSLGGDRAVSNDGNYFMYSLSNQPLGGNTIILQSIEGEWSRSFSGASDGFFSEDSKKFILIVDDTLSFVTLGESELNEKYIISSYKHPNFGKGKWLAYQLKKQNQEFILRNLVTATERRFNSVVDYFFDEYGNSLLLKMVDLIDSNVNTTLQWINLKSGVVEEIWSSVRNRNFYINSYNIDTDGKQVVFMTNEKVDDQTIKKIWYYKTGTEKAIVKVEGHSPGIPPNLSIAESEIKFSRDGRYIFFQLQGPQHEKPLPNAVSLDIWSYRDTLLQGTQLYDITPKNFQAAISVDSNVVVKLTKDYEEIKALPERGDFVVIANNDQGDRFWLRQVDSNWLISLKTGSRRLLPTGESTKFIFSPDGGYLVYYIFNKVGNYFSQNLITGNIIKISSSILTSLNDRDEFSKDVIIPSPVGVAGWYENGTLLVYDNYDIWQLDPTGKRPAVNITKGYGQIHHIKFRLVDELNGVNTYLDPKNNKFLLLVAFNTVNKFNGLYKAQVDKSINLQLLTMGPWTLDHRGVSVLPVNANEFSNNIEPIKARDANSWIVLRQTASEAPNYFLTHDLKNYYSLTNLHPEVGYNWLKTELINWRQLDGTISQGILYKPEDFDPRKRYPILFTYYEQLSHRVYEYPALDYTRTSINIPWFVSRGYLVFTPDIYYTKGIPGKSTYNTLISAALFLSKRPYVDVRHMGINGHSSGGFETNYIITHSRLFAAAMEGAGTSDWISSSLELWGIQGTSRGSRLSSYEGKIGSTLWQRPDLYIENSPVFRADKVSTPLLIFHSKDDTAVPWEQAIELFISLRRLGKKTWMLQYDGEPHGNWDATAEDFTIRVSQFFDHFLKDSPPPLWMTQGIQASKKGVDSGLELDASGRKP